MLYLLMFLQIGAMFYALRLHRRRQLFANMLPAALAVQIFGIGTAFVAILKIILLISSSGSDKEQFKQEANSEYVALWYVGQHLATKYPGKKLLVIVAPENEADRNQENRLKGLEEGINGGMELSFVPIEYLKSRGKRRVTAYNHKKLNELIQDNDHVDVVISLIGLPINYYNMECWTEDLADFYAYRGYSWEVNQDIKDEILTGFITINPTNRFKATKGKKAEKSEKFFEQHFIFVTKDNVETMERKFSSIFNLPR